MKKLLLALGVVAAGLIAGCSTPGQHVHKLALGMTTNEVLEAMGKPTYVRASKLYEGGDTQMVWEYICPVFSLGAFSDKYDKDYWVIFENNRVVQWGEPADFTGTDKLSASDMPAVQDYYNKKMIK